MNAALDRRLVIALAVPRAGVLRATATIAGMREVFTAEAASRRDVIRLVLDQLSARRIYAGQPRIVEPEPVAGMPATYHVGSDDYPCTVVERVSPTRAIIGFDDVRRGVFFVPDQGERIVVSRRRDGTWRPMGDSRGSRTRVTFGERRHYMDPHF